MFEKQKTPPKILLIINIPTHVRPLIELADSMRSSARYEPVLVYYPGDVFALNNVDCRAAPFDAYIWTGHQFVSKEQYLAADSDSVQDLNAEPQQSNRKLKDWVNCFISKLWAFFVFVAYSFGFKAVMFRALYAVLHLAARAIVFFSMLRLIGRVLVTLIGRNVSPQKRKREQRRAGRLQVLMLRMFELQWESVSLSANESAPSINRRISRLTSDGFFPGITEQKNLCSAMSTLIQKEQAECIVLAEDNLFYNSHFLINAAHLNNVPAVVVPYTIVNTLEWAEAFYELKAYQVRGLWKRLLAMAFPDWVLIHRNRHLILPSTYVLGCEFHNLTPAIPWLINSGNVDAIAAESELMSQYYLRAGIKKEKIQFTGALSDDRLFILMQQRQHFRRALERKHNISIKSRMVLIALPPNQFGGGRRQGCEFGNYDDLIQFMVGTLASLGEEDLTLVINLHPRTSRSEVASLSKLNVHIIAEPIESLVPLADCFVAVASATIRMAISCGIPVVNFDAYQYNYDDYLGIEGVCNVKTRAEYSNVVLRLINDGVFFAQMQEAQKSSADRLCILDGEAGKRMLGLFDRLIAQRPAQYGVDEK